MVNDLNYLLLGSDKRVKILLPSYKPRSKLSHGEDRICVHQNYIIATDFYHTRTNFPTMVFNYSYVAACGPGKSLLPAFSDHSIKNKKFNISNTLEAVKVSTCTSRFALKISSDDYSVHFGMTFFFILIRQLDQIG